MSPPARMPLNDDDLDALLRRAASHSPSEDVAREALAWIDGDLEALGGWVPPVCGDRMRADEVVSADAAIAAFSMRSRAPLPLAAVGCLSLFVVSTAIAVTESHAPVLGPELGFGEIASVDVLLEDPPDRFATLLLAPQPPSERSQRLLAQLRRAVEDTPAGRRRIGDSPAPRSPVPRLELRHALATLSGSGAIGSLADEVGASLGSAPRRTPLATHRELPPHAPVAPRAPGVSIEGRLGGDARGFAFGRAREPKPEPSVEPRIDRRLSSLEADRGLLADEVRRVLAARRDELRRCYESQLKRAPGLRTRIELQWQIAPGGTVHNARVVHTTQRWPALERCLLEELGTWRFPEPRGDAPVEVNYPVVFRPSSP